MKKVSLLLLTLLFCALMDNAEAQSTFSHQTSSGHTLFYKIIDPDNLKAAVVYPNNGYTSATEPTGNLTIDGTVPNDGITYTVTRIDTCAFMQCTGLTSVNIASSIKQIGYGAFYECTGLTGALNIPNGVISIHSFAFFGCSSLTSVNVSNSVQGIGYAAFYDCTGVTSVTLGSGIKSIGDWNFGYCPNLEIVNFYSDSCDSFFDTSAYSIAPAFFRSGVKTINIGPNVHHIPMYAFYDCDSLTSIVMPASVDHVGRWSFAYCDGLQNVEIASINSIGFACFDSCTSLKRVVVGSVQKMAGWCFAECGQLQHVEIGELLDTISYSCFRYDSSLTYVSIGSSINYIEQNAFASCPNIDTITCFAMIAPQLGANVFSNVSSNALILVPCGSTHYPSRWPMFNTFTDLNPLIFNAISNDDTKGYVTIHQPPTCTSPNATIRATPYSGYHFDHWSDGATDNPYLLTVTEDMTLIAYFVSDVFILNASSADESMGTVQILTAPTPTNPQGTVVAMPNEGFVFDHWSNGVTANPYTLTLTSDTTLIAYFVEQTAVAFNLTVVSSDPNKGTVQTLSEPTAEDPRATVVAIPNEGFRFDHWSNHMTANPYSLTLTSDTILIAYFSSLEGINNADENTFSVSVHHKQLVIRVNEAAPLEVYDIRGCRIYSSKRSNIITTIDVPSAGVYIVRIGLNSRKVVVL